MILDNDVLIKKPERDKLAADVARYTGTITQVPAGVSGDTYAERMNAHGRAQKKEAELRIAANARRRGARNKSQA